MKRDKTNELLAWIEEHINAEYQPHPDMPDAVAGFNSGWLTAMKATRKKIKELAKP